MHLKLTPVCPEPATNLQRGVFYRYKQLLGIHRCQADRYKVLDQGIIPRNLTASMSIFVPGICSRPLSQFIVELSLPLVAGGDIGLDGAWRVFIQIRRCDRSWTPGLHGRARPR
jgi:hypothetical protein